jgi:hypothetical protein
MKKMFFLMLALLVLGAASMNAQVRIGGTDDPSSGAVLDLNATDAATNGGKALVLPRFEAKTNFPAAVAPLKGALVYCTGNDSIYSCTGTTWVAVGAAGGESGWLLGGNTTKAGDFIGSINDRALTFQINGDTVGRLNKSGNIVAWGANALTKTTGSAATAIGGSALAANTTGTSNSAVGHLALTANETGSANTAVGRSALAANTTSGSNSAVGYYALASNTEGKENTAVGASALRVNQASGNSAFGFNALYYNTSGLHNVAVGDSASRNNTTGSRNTSLGHGAGRNITTGSNNIAIGDSTLFSAATVSNRLNIGNWIYGNDGRIRLGKTDPHAAAVLDLNENNTASAGTTSSVGGLALPRIALETITSQLNGTNPLNGTIVYNTNSSIEGAQGIGLYMWSGGKWNFLTTAVMVSSISLSPSGTVRLMVDGSVTIDADAAPANATNQLVGWSSSNPAVATVNSKGKITAVALGTATVTATSKDGGNKSQSIEVIVYDASQTVETIGSHEYSVITFPDGIGTWMTVKSREGIPTKTYNNYYYYNWADRKQACPDPWLVPSKEQAESLREFLNSSPDGMAAFFARTWEAKAGNVTAGNTVNGFGVSSYFWTDSQDENELPYRLYFNTANRSNIATTVPATHSISMRCIKP